MVAIIIDDGNAVDLTFLLHSTLHPGKTLQSTLDFCKRQFQFQPDTDNGQGIVDIVDSRWRNMQASQLTCPIFYREMYPSILPGNILSVKIGLRRQSVGDDPLFDEREEYRQYSDHPDR